MDSANLHLHHLQHQVHLNDAASSSSYENPTTFSRIGEFSDCGGILSTPFLNTSMSQVMELQDGSLNMERAPSMIEDSHHRHHHHHHRDLLSMSHNMMKNTNLHPSLLSSLHPDDLRDLSHSLMLRTFMSSSTTSSFPSLSLTDHHSNGKLSSSCQIHPSVNISEGSESPSRGFPRSSGYINQGVSLDHSMQKSHKAARGPTELMPSRQGSTKKTRLNTHLYPSLQIRKQKLGDRIASLQQLVAPYGKTDTTSVLTEAIGCIKYLQDQVQALSVPYMRRPPSSRSGASARTQGGQQVEKEDLRSRGLCLVPLSCMSYLANVGNYGGLVWPLFPTGT